MKIYNIPKGFKCLLNGSWVLVDNENGEEVNLPITFKDASGVTYSQQFFTNPQALIDAGIKVINDPGYDKLRHELTGNPVDVRQQDGTYHRDYAQSLTEKQDYINALRQLKTDECLNSRREKLTEGYLFDDGIVSIKVKADFDSVLNFASSHRNIKAGNNVSLEIEDYNGNIVDNLMPEQILSLSEELTNYYEQIRSKKNQYKKLIKEGGRTYLDNLTEFDWTIN